MFGIRKIKHGARSYESECMSCHNDRNLKRYHFKSCILKVWFADHPCVDCGETLQELLENDHFEDNKSIEKGIINLPLSKLKEELRKTQVVCVECHRKRTFKNVAPSRISAMKLSIGYCKHCNKKVEKGSEHLFDFDHLNTENKLLNLNSPSITQKRLDEEVKKCQLLCCKCHKIKSFNEYGWRRLSDFDADEIAEAKEYLNNDKNSLN
jgi:hypothetical protein